MGKDINSSCQGYWCPEEEVRGYGGQGYSTKLFGVQQKNGFLGMQAIEWTSEASPWVLALAAEINMEKKKRM